MPKKHEKKQLTEEEVVSKYAPKIEDFLGGEWCAHGVLILEAMNSFERRVVHAYAETLGLDHKTGVTKGGGHKELVIRKADWTNGLEAQLEADLERVGSVLSNNGDSFVVFEGGCGRGVTTRDTRGLFYGLAPRGSGDWDLTVTATPKQHAAAGIENEEDRTEYIECEDLESLLVDLLQCDYDFVCPNGDGEEGGCEIPDGAQWREYPCACWQGQRVHPQKVCWGQEWDGNSGDVHFETDEYCFLVEYSTS